MPPAFWLRDRARMHLTRDQVVEAGELGSDVVGYVLQEVHHQILPSTRVWPSVEHDVDRSEIVDNEMRHPQEFGLRVDAMSVGIKAGPRGYVFLKPPTGSRVRDM